MNMLKNMFGSVHLHNAYISADEKTNVEGSLIPNVALDSFSHTLCPQMELPQAITTYTFYIFVSVDMTIRLLSALRVRDGYFIVHSK